MSGGYRTAVAALNWYVTVDFQVVAYFSAITAEGYRTAPNRADADALRDPTTRDSINPGRIRAGGAGARQAPGGRVCGRMPPPRARARPPPSVQPPGIGRCADDTHTPVAAPRTRGGARGREGGGGIPARLTRPSARPLTGGGRARERTSPAAARPLRPGGAGREARGTRGGSGLVH